MKRILAVATIIAAGALFPSLAKGEDCKPACSSGSSCCVMQYSNGTYGKPYCKTGSCYTTSNVSPLKISREIDASAIKDTMAVKPANQLPADQKDKRTSKP